MAASLLLVRAGRKVVLVEGDQVDPDEDWRVAWERGRKGVPHLLQPHVLLSRGARLLRDRSRMLTNADARNCYGHKTRDPGAQCCPHRIRSHSRCPQLAPLYLFAPFSPALRP